MYALLTDVHCSLHFDLLLKRIHLMTSGSVWVSDHVGPINTALQGITTGYRV